MTYFMFHMAYFMVYFMFLGAAIALAQLLLDRLLPVLGVNEAPAVRLILAVVLFAGIGVAYRRGHHAAVAYGNRDLSLLEAHYAAGAALRAELACLPMVGHLFGGERDKD